MSELRKILEELVGGYASKDPDGIYWGYDTDNNIIGCLNNIHDGIKASVAVLKAGHACFCPWLDYQFQFFDKTLTVEDYYRYSMAWLEVSDEVWVLPNSENSKGTQVEIIRAKELGIPSFPLWGVLFKEI